MALARIGTAIGFLSTPSARRATRHFAAQMLTTGHFYPRPPRGGRLDAATLTLKAQIISIHALREEGDDPARHRTRQAV